MKLTWRKSDKGHSLFGMRGDEIVVFINLVANSERINVTIFTPVAGCPYRYVHHICTPLAMNIDNLLCEKLLVDAVVWVESDEGQAKLAAARAEKCGIIK